MERLHRKRFGFILAIICCCVPIFAIFNTNSTKIASANNGSSYAVIDVDSGKILLSENENLRLYMASTTKIMTALITIENYDLNEKVKIKKNMVDIEGSSVYLREGEELTLGDLLYCMMLRSGNDAATAIALHVCNSTEVFAEMMNIRAESLGLKNTHFVNSHGLHDDNHFTSSKDLAIIAATAMKNDIFRKIVSTKKITVGQGDSARLLINKNKMLTLYPNANGIKTGYTKKSGRCLVSSAKKNGKTLVCVVLNVYDTYGQSAKYLNKGFEIVNKTLDNK